MAGTPRSHARWVLVCIMVCVRRCRDAAVQPLRTSTSPDPSGVPESQVALWFITSSDKHVFDECVTSFIRQEVSRKTLRLADAVCIPCSVTLLVSVPGRMQVGPKYKLEKYLGSGSFSSVCLALDTETGLKVRWQKLIGTLPTTCLLYTSDAADE